MNKERLGVKVYDPEYIDDAEIAQLIILQGVYSQFESRDVFFQGGTAIRWCHGGNRFSEDLDFVTPLSREEVAVLVEKSLKLLERGMVAHFGTGSFFVNVRKSRATAYRAFVDYKPATTRTRISVRIEFEQLLPGAILDTEKLILSALPRVAHLLAVGALKIPVPNTVFLVETKEEILSDKARSLLERPYVKGRDFYDIWFLTHSLGVACSPERLQKKLSMYQEPFRATRSPKYFMNLLSDETAAANVARMIRNDLVRFIPRDVMSVVEADNFRVFREAAADLFANLQRAENPDEVQRENG
jgi:predicted nucleotidyltransferase component of viral defense system